MLWLIQAFLMGNNGDEHDTIENIILKLSPTDRLIEIIEYSDSHKFALMKFSWSIKSWKERPSGPA